MVKNFKKLYNHERKVRFLEEEYPNEGTRQTYNSILQAIAKFEEDKNKDLCDFSYSDAVELLIGLKKKTYKSLDVAQTVIIKYIDWCEKNGYSKLGFNNFKLMNKEDLQKYTHQIAQKKSYISREQIYEIADQLYNWVDKALLVLPFEGIRGRSDSEHSFEEIRNLKFRDLIPTANTVIVTRDNGEQRAVKVDPRTMDILIRSHEETDYHKNNGLGTGRLAVMPLKETDYLVRVMDTKKESLDDRINVSSINTKFRNFRLYTGIQFLNPTIVFQSGLIEKCREIEERNGKLQSEDYKDIFRNLKLDDRNWFDFKELYESYKKNTDPR